MSTSTFTGNDLYRNVRSGLVTKILSQTGDRTLIATVKDGETSRTRTVPTSSIHQSTLNAEGEFHTFGYVPLDASTAQQTTTPSPDRSDMDLMDNLDALSDAELAALINKHERIKRESADIADRAKAVAKSRRGNNLGIDIQGDLALIYTSGSKFDAPTARRNLSSDDFKKILLAKPDATLARKLFENEPEKLAACLKDNGPSLTVREATDEDRARYASSHATDDEDFVIHS
jgi:hypothetical protein